MSRDIDARREAARVTPVGTGLMIWGCAWVTSINLESEPRSYVQGAPISTSRADASLQPIRVADQH